MKEKGFWQEHPGLIEDLKDWKQKIQWSVNKTDTLITKIHIYARVSGGGNKVLGYIFI